MSWTECDYKQGQEGEAFLARGTLWPRARGGNKHSMWYEVWPDGQRESDMMGRGLAEARLRGDSSEGKELDVSGAWTLQIVGTFGEAPLIF